MEGSKNWQSIVEQLWNTKITYPTTKEKILHFVDQLQKKYEELDALKLCNSPEILRKEFNNLKERVHKLANDGLNPEKNKELATKMENLFAKVRKNHPNF